MTRGRPKADLVITEDERAQLTSFARSRSLPASLSGRARIVLNSADGEANSSIAECLELGEATVGKWCVLASSNAALPVFTTTCDRVRCAPWMTRAWLV